MVEIGIIITQSGVSGGAGESREDLELNLPVTLNNINESGITSYKWEIIGKPYSSTAILSSVSSSEVFFTPDVVGSYLIQLTINNKTKQRVVAAILTDRYGIRIPAAGEGEEILGGSFKAITESIRTLEEDSLNAARLQGKDISLNAPKLNDFLKYNGEEWIPSSKVRADDIGFSNNQDIFIKIPLSTAIPANSYWEYSAGTSTIKPHWKSKVGSSPTLDFSWNAFPHGSVLKKIYVIASCTEVSNQLTINVKKKGAVWSSNQIISLIDQFVSNTNYVVSSISTLEVEENIEFTHGNSNDDIIVSEDLSIRLIADGSHEFKIFDIYVHFQTLAVGLYNGPLIAEGGGGEEESVSGCCPFHIVLVEDTLYDVPVDGQNSLYVSNKLIGDPNVVFNLPKSSDVGEGANFEFLAIGNFNSSLHEKFVLHVDTFDSDGITWVNGDSVMDLATDQPNSKIRLVSNGGSGWYAESGEGLWGSVAYTDKWKYSDKFLYTANVLDSNENNITTFDAYGNIKDSGISINDVTINGPITYLNTWDQIVSSESEVTGSVNIGVSHGIIYSLTVQSVGVESSDGADFDLADSSFSGSYDTLYKIGLSGVDPIWNPSINPVWKDRNPFGIEGLSSGNIYWKLSNYGSVEMTFRVTIRGMGWFVED